MFAVLRNKETPGKQGRALPALKIIAGLSIMAIMIFAPQPIRSSAQPLDKLSANAPFLLASSLLAAGQPSVASVTVLNSETLTGSLNPSTNKLVLEYSGSGLLNIGLLDHPFIIFQMPSEFSTILQNPSFQSSLVAKYDVPVISILGQEIGRNVNTFSEINIDSATNSISMNFKRMLTVNLLSNSAFKFTLEATLPSLPPAEDGTYTFYASVRQGLINLSLLDSKPVPLNIKAPVKTPVNAPAKPTETTQQTPSQNNPQSPDANQGKAAPAQNEVTPNENPEAQDKEEVDGQEQVNSGKENKEKSDNEAAVKGVNEEAAVDDSSNSNTVIDFLWIGIITIIIVAIGLITRIFRRN